MFAFRFATCSNNLAIALHKREARVCPARSEAKVQENVSEKRLVYSERKVVAIGRGTIRGQRGRQDFHAGGRMAAVASGSVAGG